MSEKSDEKPSKTTNDLNETNEDEEVFTLSELLDQQREIDEDVAAVLGGSDENFCTYSKGYINRQALYACLTCVPESKEKPEKRAGVCLACSYKCHDGHDLIELYTKRNFRCDCGTSKILTIRCKLEPNKMEDNEQNSYNHNYSGVYCTCKRPYPDPDESAETSGDEMVQCVVCEDWYHTRHLGGDIPDSNDFDEMICDACTAKNDFLSYYSVYRMKQKVDANQTSDTSIAADISVTDLDESNKSVIVDDNTKPPVAEQKEEKEEILNAEINQCIQDIIDINKSNVQLDGEASGSTSGATLKRSNETNGTEPANKRIKIDNEKPSSSNSDVCRKPTTAEVTFAGASFWPFDWRAKLCKCSNCLPIYQKNGVEFLTDEDDTVRAYQERGKAKAQDISTSSIQETMRAISGMDRVAQIETALAYNKLKQKLTEFLTTFVANQQVITAKDVDTFFQTMSNDKKE